MSETTDLFKDFRPISSREWKQQIQMELKGADYTDAMVWQTLEGIDVKPFYHADDYEYLNIPSPKEDFKIMQPIFVDDPEVANKLALDAFAKGAEAVQFIETKSFDIDVLFQNFNTLKKKHTIFFKSKFLSSNFSHDLLTYFDPNSVNLQIDIIGNLAETGNWFLDESRDFEALKNIFKKHTSDAIVNVDASVYQNAGANMIQQIGYALAHASEYFKILEKENATIFQFEFAIGSNYFFEIAKLRAFRYLWQQLIKEYGIELPVRLIAKPTLRNKTLYDYNVNMLRTTSEYMSAALGGADFVLTQSYDSFFKKSNHFSNRIARNQLLLLREENGFAEAHNFAQGSYYIETLTLEITKKALQLFKDIEKTGGFLASLKSGLIQRKISESAQKEQGLFDSKKIMLVGSNKFPTPDDKMKQAMELYPFVKKTKKQTTIQPIIGKRLSEKLEQERLDKE